jgi:spore coat polysaccharide biosynthesis protein SpsF
MEIKTLAIIQARFGSTRLPGKVLKKINAKSLLEIGLNRISKSKKIDKIVVATTDNRIDEAIVDEVKKLGFDYFRGSEKDVLDRFYKTALLYKPQWIVRITSDCPLIDSILIDQVIEFTFNNNVDYGANILEERFPDGQDIEVFTFEALEKAWQESQLFSDREHVTPYIRRNSTFFNENKFRSSNFYSSIDYSNVRMTVDEPEDFTVIENLINSLGLEKKWEEYVLYMMENDLTKINSKIIRNEGYLKSLKND